ncbi:bifunctional diaminohydroxyphosphoribosylaminopyrimidine deaminase/5-amino-6-(5-phosphoribosylamino)uracil reductase RibD [Alsobacter sp. R-9]
MGGPRGPAGVRLSPERQARVDEAMMAMALSLARRGLGNTWPNPAVGAVVWHMTESGPRIVGRGFTQPGGRPHAETVALAQAGEQARGASMAVTLEPCSHHGRTPPCCEAVVAAGIARVVSAIEDPDPRVNGRGHIFLRAQGVEVTVGTLAREARRVNQGFIRKVVDNRPMVTVKLARTADGFAAAAGPERLMITGRAAAAKVHKMRARHDAIMVGIGTVLADDPLLTCRMTGLSHRSPVRVVLDPSLRIRPDARIVSGEGGPATWIIAADDAPWGVEQGLAAFGVPVDRVRRAPGGVDLRAALAALARRGITRVFCEGGPRLADALAADGLVDDVVLLTGPRRLDGPGLPAAGPSLQRLMDDRAQFEALPPRMLGGDEMRCFRRII